MKAGVQIVGALTLGLMISGCSKTDEMTNKAATNLVNRIKTPIDEVRAVSAKAAATREPDLPK